MTPLRMVTAGPNRPLAGSSPARGFCGEAFGDRRRNQRRAQGAADAVGLAVAQAGAAALAGRRPRVRRRRRAPGIRTGPAGVAVAMSLAAVHAGVAWRARHAAHVRAARSACVRMRPNPALMQPAPARRRSSAPTAPAGRRTPPPSCSTVSPTKAHSAGPATTVAMPESLITATSTPSRNTSTMPQGCSDCRAAPDPGSRAAVDRSDAARAGRAGSAAGSAETAAWSRAPAWRISAMPSPLSAITAPTSVDLGWSGPAVRSPRWERGWRWRRGSGRPMVSGTMRLSWAPRWREFGAAAQCAACHPRESAGPAGDTPRRNLRTRPQAELFHRAQPQDEKRRPVGRQSTESAKRRKQRTSGRFCPKPRAALSDRIAAMEFIAAGARPVALSTYLAHNNCNFHPFISRSFKPG